MNEGERIIEDCIVGIENFYGVEFPKRAGFIASYGKQIDALLVKDRETISDYRKAMNAISVALSSVKSARTAAREQVDRVGEQGRTA